MRVRARERICPRCSAKGSHAMNCPEPAIKRAEGALHVVLDTKRHVLADAIDRAQVNKLEQLMALAMASIERRSET